MGPNELSGPHFLGREIAKKCVPIINLTRAADLNVPEIVRQIDEVQVISHRLLRVANSAVTGLHHTVTSVEQAVVLLGPRRVRIILEQLQYELERAGAKAV